MVRACTRWRRTCGSPVEPVQRLTKPEIDKLLATGQLDMVIGPPVVLPDDLRARVVSTENFRCVMRKDHPFAQAEMTLDDFCAFEHIFVSPFGGDFRGDVDAALESMDRSRRVVVSVPSVLVATRILETSNFVGVFSEALARREAHLLRSYPLPLDIGKLQLVLAWHERTHVNPAHQWFRERIARRDAAGRRRLRAEALRGALDPRTGPRRDPLAVADAGPRDRNGAPDRVRRASPAVRYSGTATVLPLTEIAFAATGVVTKFGTFDAVIAGAAPGTPPRGVVRTTCDAGSAVPFFRFA